jgi:2-C-methyl-D-erythritol 4-phosphate cytidylyltransferase
MIRAVIVAGGCGSRMQALVKKQYLQLAGVPILSRTLMAIDRHANLDRITLVVPEEDLTMCRTAILGPLSLGHDIQLVAGGRRRQESVLNGLNALDGDDGVVMIHDGVRPFVRSLLMDRCLAGVQATGACIPAIPATDTLKQVDSSGVIVCTLDRQGICLAQTPQTFSLRLIRRAHQLAALHGFAATDDASVAEFAGESVVVVPGDRDNIKITTPQDLVVARAILENWNADAAGARDCVSV